MTTPDGRWHAGIGDPTLLGWVTVGAYAAAFVLCAACTSRSAKGSRERWFWLAVASLMAFLAVNKQLDLQTWLTQVGRDIALSEGWYQRRQVVQEVFIAAMLAGAVVAALVMQQLVRGLGAAVKGAALGVVVLIAFILMRAASFHHIDRLLGVGIGGVRVNVLLELGGIAAVAASAGLALAGGRRTRFP